MGRPSLVYQVKSILSEQFSNGFGRSKHVDKKNHTNIHAIYSRNTYKSAMQKCCTFLTYCKENFELKNLDGLQANYFIQFIKVKGYSKEVAYAYRWAVKKMQDVYNATNNTCFTWVDADFNMSINEDKDTLRIQMPREIHNQIIKQAYHDKFENGLAFDIARALGLRVSEITNLRMKNFKFNTDGNLKEVYIHGSKGGRNRTIFVAALTQKQIEKILTVYKYFINLRNEGDRLFINKSGSYQKAFANARNKVTPLYKQCNIHSLRKEFANDYYDREIQKNRLDKEVRQELTKLLGHKRLNVLKYYLKD